MKAFKLGALMTRKFPAWLQAFNVLCGVTALAILGFGLWHLRARTTPLASVLEPGSATVRADALEAALSDPAKRGELATSLARARDQERLAVLLAARESVHEGALDLARETLAAPRAVPPTVPDPARDVARRVLEDGVGGGPWDQDVALVESSRALAPVARLVVPFHAVVRGTAAERRRAVDRLAATRDPRATVALLLALRAPPGEEDAAEAAEAALEHLHGQAPDSPLGREGRIAALLHEKKDPRAAPPYDVRAEGDALLRLLEDPKTELSRAIAALRGLGLLGHEPARAAVEARLEHDDPIVRATAAWALGRVLRPHGRGGTLPAGPKAAAPPKDEAWEAAIAKLVRRLEDTYAPARVAATWSLGRLGAPREVAPAFARLLEDPDTAVKRQAALELLAMNDERGLELLHRLAFEPGRSGVERRRELEGIDAHARPAVGAAFWVGALSHEDERVREAAKIAVQRRAGSREIRSGFAAWQRWLEKRFEIAPVTTQIRASEKK